jgi:hypothetical protein
MSLESVVHALARREEAHTQSASVSIFDGNHDSSEDSHSDDLEDSDDSRYGSP